MNDRLGYRPGRPGYGRPGYGWNNWYNRHYHHHHGWHNGCWHRPWRPPSCWGYWWNRYPALTAFGVTTWGINRCGWAFGYNSYYNPYVTSNTVYVDNSIYDYSQPIMMAPGESSFAGNPMDLPPESIPEVSLTAFDEARQEFYAGDYTGALESTNEALRDNPNDAVIHEFRALTLFAMGEYQDSAATLYAVLSVGPGWDWTTLIGLYPDVETYTTQLRALEGYVGDHPDDNAGLLILSYQYITAGHDDAAATELKRLIQLTPTDPVAIQLLLSVDPEAQLPEQPKEVVPPKPTSEIAKAQLDGSWSAKRGDRQFDMDLKEDGTFAWTYSEGDQSQEVTGVWGVDDQGILAMEMNDDGVMLAQVLMNDGKLDFYMLGDTQDEPPLEFAKS
ncbi:MAG: tetratricopeptide repeat protein [Rubripirellula sp.]